MARTSHIKSTVQGAGNTAGKGLSHVQAREASLKDSQIRAMNDAALKAMLRVAK